ncbi:hypothetical protein ACIBF1_32935 [Spirillospora sp. NPDC050679]
MSEYQYYEFLAADRPLDEDQQAQVRALSTRARITATGFTNDYEWGDFRGDPGKLMELYYDAHLYVANWGSRRLMLRLPRRLLEPKAVEPYRVEPYVAAWATEEHLVLDLTSEDEEGDWEEEAKESLSAVIGVRAELTTGDLRPLYLAWLAAYGTWERDEDAFGDKAESELEPPVPAGLGSLTAPQRALADFLRLDPDLLAVAARTSPPVTGSRSGPRELARRIRELPPADKDGLLLQVAEGHGARVQMELLGHLRDTPEADADRSRRTVAQLLDSAADIRQERQR